MKEFVDDNDSILVKVMVKSYFIKLKDVEVIIFDVLVSLDVVFVEKVVN